MALTLAPGAGTPDPRPPLPGPNRKPGDGTPTPPSKYDWYGNFSIFHLGHGIKEHLCPPEDQGTRHSERSGSGPPLAKTKPWSDRLRPVRCVRRILRAGLGEGAGGGSA